MNQFTHVGICIVMNKAHASKNGCIFAFLMLFVSFLKARFSYRSCL